MAEKKILIISGCKYPEGDAGSVRIHSLVKLFETCGKESIVIGKGKNVSENGADYDGVHYYSFRSDSQTLVNKIKDRISYSSKIKDFLAKYGNEFSHFLIVDIPFKALDYTIHWAKNNGIQLMHDSLEWYSASEFRCGKLNPLYIHRDILNRKKITSDFKVIAISQYLQDYFKLKGCSTIRVPAILGSSLIENKNEITSKIIVTYAGLPERKDKIIDILDAFVGMPDYNRNKIELRIIGITLKQLSEKFNLSQEKFSAYADSVIFYGRISRSEVMSKLSETHFTIFYRDANERYAKAGFPTKVAESMSVGVPVITNLTSDLEFYLINGVNSILIGTEKDNIRRALIDASRISVNDYAKLASHAKDTFNQNFDYHVYSSSMQKFLR